MPHAPQIEAGFLFALLSPSLRTPTMLDAMRQLTPEHFFVPQNARIFQAMLELDAEGMTPDPLTVGARLRGVPAPAVGWHKYITETVSIEGAHAEAPPSDYVDILAENWRLRETIRVCSETIEKAKRGTRSEKLSVAAGDALSAVNKHAAKLPPHDLDAETSIVTSLLLSYDRVPASTRESVLTMLRGDYFYDMVNGRIFDAIRCLAESGEGVDAVTVAGYLREQGQLRRVGGTAHLARLCENAVHTSTALLTYAKTVYDHWRIRQTLTAAHRIVAEGHEGIGDAAKWIESHAGKLALLSEDVTTDDSSARAPNVSKETRAVLAEQIKDLTKGLETQTITGTTVDGIAGPLRPALTIVAAWSGVGKTSLAREWILNMAERPIRRRGVILFSLEMTRQEVLEAMAYGIARVDSSKLGRGIPLTIDEANQLGEAFSWLEKLNWLWIYDEENMGDMTPANMEATVRRVRDGEAKKLGVDIAAVFVDYLQLVTPPNERAPEIKQLDDIAKGLRRLAQRLTVPVVALCQLNEDDRKRSSSSKDGDEEEQPRPSPQNLRGSKGIFHAANRVIIIHNPHYSKRAGAVVGKGSYIRPKVEPVEIIVGKNRNGANGTASMEFLPWCTRFQDAGRQALGDLP